MFQKIEEKVSQTDHEKRNTLKIIGAAAVVTCTPSLVAGAVNNVDTMFGDRSNELKLSPAGSSARSLAELDITLELEPEPLLILTNHSDRVIIVSQVYPGIVHAGSVAFDINSVFEESAHAVSGGTSRRFSIQPTPRFPATENYASLNYYLDKHRNKPVQVAKLTGLNEKGVFATSSRSFFS